MSDLLQELATCEVERLVGPVKPVAMEMFLGIVICVQLLNTHYVSLQSLLSEIK